MAKRSTDPLTAATTSILMPAIRSHGFRKKTIRKIVRIQDDILQLIDLNPSAYGGKEFRVNYATLSLFMPRDYLILQPGGNLQWENGAEAWLPAKTQAEADESMGKTVTMFQSQALPFFEGTRTVEGLLEHLSREHWGSGHHLYLEMAFCEARRGHGGKALEHAIRAIELYKEDGSTWCADFINLCQQLISGIESNTLTMMFSQWIEYSIRKLGLSKIRP